jgi:hypothetical protein
MAVVEMLANLVEQVNDLLGKVNWRGSEAAYETPHGGATKQPHEPRG